MSQDPTESFYSVLNRMFESDGEIHALVESEGIYVSIHYDYETESVVAYSKYGKLDSRKPLNGFWNYAQSLDVDIFRVFDTWLFFGEWDGSQMHIFDIYDVENKYYLPQVAVEIFCDTYEFDYAEDKSYANKNLY